MRYAVIADIHANLAAFVAVLRDIELGGGVDEFWCLGDIIGYGPDPHQCLELLRQYNHICVAGNHDWAVIGKIDTSDFNPDAAAACHWTARQLSTGDILYLEGLPQIIQRRDFTLVHGSPREPIGEYLISARCAEENLGFLHTQFCLVGHSHLPLMFRFDKNDVCSFNQISANPEILLENDQFIINPGSVGQPRDGDPRASYAIYDAETRMFNLLRIPYDIAATQARMIEHRLPMHLVTRLKYGI